MNALFGGNGLSRILGVPSFNLLQYPLAFLNPLYISGHSAWVGHIPFAWALLEMARPRTFVELGTHKGDSYLAFCQGIRALKLPTRCTAVDTWKGDSHTGGYEDSVYESLRAYHDPNYSSFSALLRTDFDSAAEQCKDGTIDLLHIDGLHTYSAVKHDFERWRPKLSERGIVLFHDTAARFADFGVWELWAQLAPQFPSFEFLHENGLGVLGVGNDLPKAFLEFMDVAQRERDLVRLGFEVLGGRMTIGNLTVVWSRALHATNDALNEWRKRNGRTSKQLSADMSSHGSEIYRDVLELLAENQRLRSS
jgi:hypothetical protein